MSLAKDSQKLKAKKFRRGHTELNHGPIDLQSIALPLSYTPRQKVNRTLNKMYSLFSIMHSCSASGNAHTQIIKISHVVTGLNKCGHLLLHVSSADSCNKFLLYTSNSLLHKIILCQTKYILGDCQCTSLNTLQMHVTNF